MPKLIKAVVKKLPQLSGFHMGRIFFNILNTFFVLILLQPHPYFYYFSDNGLTHIVYTLAPLKVTKGKVRIWYNYY